MRKRVLLHFPRSDQLGHAPRHRQGLRAIGKFSKHDAEIYPEFHEYMVNMLAVAGIGSQSAPPPYGTMMNVMYMSPKAVSSSAC